MARIEPEHYRLADGRLFTVRTAEPADARAWLDLRDRVLADAPYLATSTADPAHAEDRIVARLTEALDSTNALELLGSIDGRLVADIGFHPGSRRKLRHHGTLGMSVAPDERGHGVGTALLLTIMTWAVRHPEIEKIALGVYPENTPARRLYERFGFVEEGRTLRFFKNLDGTYSDDISMAVYVKPGIAPPGFRTWGADFTPPAWRR